MNEEEQKSLNRVKRYAFCDKERSLQRFFPYKFNEFIDVNNEENIYDYIRINRNSFFGMQYNDIKTIYLALQNAKRNEKASCFPDFILNNGFIEHFRITSSNETKKGSAKIIGDKNFDRMIELERKKFKEECENGRGSRNSTQSWVHLDVCHSYDNLEKSFYKNFNKHLKSLGKYTGNKQLKIFLIEYTDLGVEMIENIAEEEMKNNRSLKRQHFNIYMLSKDKKMLEYLYQFKEQIDYIIYDYACGFEIIKLADINKIIEDIPFEYVILGRRNIIRKADSYFSLVFSTNNNKS